MVPDGNSEAYIFEGGIAPSDTFQLESAVTNYDDKLIKTILEAIDLIHEVLKLGTLDEDLRIKLAKWRAVAEDMVP